jgi:hypothetical protein
VVAIGLRLHTGTWVKVPAERSTFSSTPTILLILFIDGPRTNNEFAGKPAVSLRDDCFIHTRATVLATSREDDIDVLAFPPPTT